MKLYTEELYGKETSVERIKGLCLRHSRDIGSKARLSGQQFFDMVRRIPYRRDRKALDAFGHLEGIEVIARPSVLLDHQDVGIDCKKKCILMICWAIENNVPWRIVTSSRRPDKVHHHIFPQWKIDGVWKNADATYSHYKLGEQKELTDFTIYEGSK